MNLKVSIPKLPILQSALNSLNINQILGTVINNASLYLRDTAKEYIISGRGYRKAPFITGTLRSSVRATVTPLKGTIYPTVGYAEYVHEGRGTSRSYGRRPFMDDAAKDTEPFIKKELERETKEALKKLVNKVN